MARQTPQREQPESTNKDDQSELAGGTSGKRTTDSQTSGQETTKKID